MPTLTEPHIIARRFRERRAGQSRRTGAYVDDMALPGMIYGANGAQHDSAGEKIKKINLGRASHGMNLPWSAREIFPGKLHCTHFGGSAVPRGGVVNHPEEPILLLAHADRQLLRKAVEAVSIEYEELPSVFSMEESERKKAKSFGARTMFSRLI